VPRKEEEEEEKTMPDTTHDTRHNYGSWRTLRWPAAQAVIRGDQPDRSRPLSVSASFFLDGWLTTCRCVVHVVHERHDVSGYNHHGYATQPSGGGLLGGGGVKYKVLEDVEVASIGSHV
jgi:hypothetical protein